MVFFGGFALLFWFFPLNNELNVIALLGVIIILGGFGIVFQLIFIMSQRILIDLVPSEIRNSVYSLIPTLAALFGVPFMIIIGFTLDTINFSTGPLILLGLAIISTIFFMLYARETSRVTKTVQTLPENLSPGGIKAYSKKKEY